MLLFKKYTTMVLYIWFTSFFKSSIIGFRTSPIEYFRISFLLTMARNCMDEGFDCKCGGNYSVESRKNLKKEYCSHIHFIVKGNPRLISFNCPYHVLCNWHLLLFMSHDDTFKWILPMLIIGSGLGSIVY